MGLGQSVNTGTKGRVKDFYDVGLLKTRVVKKVPRTEVEEITIMEQIVHPNIAKVFQTLEQDDHFFFIMETCSGGDLLDRLLEAGHFSEVQSAFLLKQMLSAVDYLHKESIVHGDLRPDNFLVPIPRHYPIERATLKLTGFGMARWLPIEDFTTKRPSYPYYVAPEVLNGRYGHQADLWSLGAMLYLFLAGHPPFNAGADEAVLDQVRSGNYYFSKTWRRRPDARELTRRLLILDPQERCTAEQAQRSDFMRMSDEARAPTALWGVNGRVLADDEEEIVEQTTRLMADRQRQTDERRRLMEDRLPLVKMGLPDELEEDDTNEGSSSGLTAVSPELTGETPLAAVCPAEVPLSPVSPCPEDEMPSLPTSKMPQSAFLK